MKKYTVHAVWLAVAIAAFAGGMYYGKATASPAANAKFGGGFGQRASEQQYAGGSAGGSSTAGNFVAGKVISRDQQSITLALANGNSEVIFYSSSTPAVAPSPVSMSTVATGSDIMVVGSQNSDGSFTARSIEVGGRFGVQGAQ